MNETIRVPAEEIEHLRMVATAAQAILTGRADNVWGILTAAYPDATSDQKLRASLAAMKATR